MYITKVVETIRFICSSFLTLAIIMRKTGKGRNKYSGLVNIKTEKQNSTLPMLWLVLIIQSNKKISYLVDYYLYATLKYVNWTVRINIFHQ